MQKNENNYMPRANLGFLYAFIPFPVSSFQCLSSSAHFSMRLLDDKDVIFKFTMVTSLRVNRITMVISLAVNGVIMVLLLGVNGVTIVMAFGMNGVTMVK